MTKKTALFGLLITGIILISTVDTSAQRKGIDRSAANRGRISNLAVDTSDPSGNTVYTGRRRATATQTASNVVAGNKIGTDRSLLNNKNPELTRNRSITSGSGLVQPTVPQTQGNDFLMEETSIVPEGIELAIIRRRGDRP